MKKSKIVLTVLMMVGMMVLFSGCLESGNKADREQAEETEILMQEINNQVGIPNITNFYEKKMAKQVYELRDDADLVTHAYTMSQYSGKYIYLGRCVGFGLPYSTQYTNPEKRVWNGGSAYQTPQPEPNGLFTAEGLSATWLMLVNEDTGEAEVAYFEPEIVVTQSKLPKRLCEIDTLPADY